MKHYTSIEQSKKLLELGLSPESADFEYKCVGYTMHTTRPTDDFKYKVMLKEQNILHEPKYDIPCWSLGALLEVMPKIECEGELYRPMFGKFIMNRNYYCDYSNDCQEGIKQILCDTPIEAAFKIVVWLLKNGYIKNRFNDK